MPDQGGFLRGTAPAGGSLGPLIVQQPEIQLADYAMGTAIITPDAAFATAKAANPGGGTFVAPAGTFNIGGTTASPVNHDLTGAQYNLKGQGIGVTVFQVPRTSGGAVFVTHRLEVFMEDFSLRGPGVGGDGSTTVGAAVTPANVASAPTTIGIVARDRCTMNRVRVTHFGQGVIIDGNHQRVSNCTFTQCKWNLVYGSNQQGFATIQASSFTHGNQQLDNVDLTGAGEASLHIGDDYIDSVELSEVHFGFGPIGIQAAAKVTYEIAINNTSFHGCSFESVGENYMKDLGYLTANRRLFKGLRFYEQHDGPMAAGNSRTGSIGTEMVKLGEMIDWTIWGFTGDTSNSTFPITCGTGGCGFRAETIQGFRFHDADQLWTDAAVQVKPMFVIGTGGGWGGPTLKDVYIDCFKRYTAAILRNNSGGTFADGKIVMPAVAGEPWGGGFVGGYDVSLATNARPSIGRVAAAGPLTTGSLVPVVVYGESNSVPVVTVTGIVAGSPLTADAANPGSVKLAAAFTDPVIATAMNTPSAGTVEGIIRGPLQPV
jgi:hypothetical protein